MVREEKTFDGGSKMTKRFLAYVMIGKSGVCVEPFTIFSETGDINECIKYIIDMFPNCYIDGFLTDVFSNQFSFIVE